MELPPGPPSLGESSPPPPPDRYAEDEVEVVDADAHDGLLADEEANRRLVATTAALALVAVAVMIGVFLLTDRDSPDQVEAATPPPPAATIPTATTVEPDPQIDQAELDAVIQRATDFVTEQRGLDFEDDVPVVVVSRQDYVELSGQEFDRRAAELGSHLGERAQVYHALGFWPPGTDPVALNRELQAQSTVAYYDADEKQVVMGVTELNPLFEVTLVHALTHALDDQHFGIDRPELLGRNDESAAAFHALVEGDARRMELAYQATLTDEQRTALADEAAAATPTLDPADFPEIMSLESDFASGAGQAFVQGLLDEGGNAELDRAFRRPPRTTEEIQEPAIYLDGTPPTDVEIPAAGATPAGEGIVGQAVFDWMTVIGRGEEASMAEWNGDHYVVWPHGDQVCIRVDAVGDVNGLAEQLQGWAELAAAEVTVDGDQLQVTACH
jgi:hypothetical protein